MTDRVYPSAKPNPPPAEINCGAVNGPGKSTQLYDPNRPRPVYRPEHHRGRRSCSCRKFCCLSFLYTLISILSLLLLAAIAATIIYLLYHPKHPNFAVSSVKISKFNFTAASDFSRLSSRIDFTLTAKNPNKKHIVFTYDSFSFSAGAAAVSAGDTTLPGFVHVEGNTTVIRATVVGDSTRNFDSDTVSLLKADLGKKSGFPITVKLDTKVEIQIGKIKSKRVWSRVNCNGIRGFQPNNATAKTPTLGITTGAKCKVDFRIKIWKLSF